MIIWVSCCYLSTQFWLDNTNELIGPQASSNHLLLSVDLFFSQWSCVDKWHPLLNISSGQLSVILDSLFLNSHFQIVTISSNHHFTPPTATNLVQASIISSLVDFHGLKNSLLSCPTLSILPIAARVMFLNHTYDHIKSFKSFNFFIGLFIKTLIMEKFKNT